MLWFKLLFLLTFVSLLGAEEQNEETTPENEREMRQFNQEVCYFKYPFVRNTGWCV